MTQTPANANETCVGPDSAQAGKADGCEGCPNQSACASGKQAQVAENNKVDLPHISHVILVLSGKGGVGKSTVAAQLALKLAEDGNFAVGLLDLDLTGPSVPRMTLGSAHAAATVERTATQSWRPVYARQNLAVMSINFLLAEKDQAVVWRGPRKNAMIRQFLSETDWRGDTDGLDYLIIDTPPGTGDEHISIVQMLKNSCKALIVTTPEEVSLQDVRKELSFCRKTGVPVLGMIENMRSYETCVSTLRFSDDQGKNCTDQVLATLREKCPEVLNLRITSDLFQSELSRTEQMAKSYNVPFWGGIPLDPELLKACEAGKAYTGKTPAAIALAKFATRIAKELPVDMTEG